MEALMPLGRDDAPSEERSCWLPETLFSIRQLAETISRKISSGSKPRLPKKDFWLTCRVKVLYTNKVNAKSIFLRTLAQSRPIGTCREIFQQKNIRGEQKY